MRVDRLIGRDWFNDFNRMGDDLSTLMWDRSRRQELVYRPYRIPLSFVIVSMSV